MRHVQRGGILLLAAAIVLAMGIDLETRSEQRAMEENVTAAHNQFRAHAAWVDTLLEQTASSPMPARLHDELPEIHTQASGEMEQGSPPKAPLFVRFVTSQQEPLFLTTAEATRLLAEIHHGKEKTVAVALLGFSGLLLLAAVWCFFARRTPPTPNQGQQAEAFISSKDATFTSRAGLKRGDEEAGNRSSALSGATGASLGEPSASSDRSRRARYRTAAMLTLMSLVLFAIAGHITMRNHQKAEEAFVEAQWERLTRLAALMDHHTKESRPTDGALPPLPLEHPQQGELPSSLLICSPTGHVFFDPAPDSAQESAMGPGIHEAYLPASVYSLLQTTPNDAVLTTQHEGATVFVVAVANQEGWRFLAYTGTQALYTQESLHTRNMLAASLFVAAGLFLFIGGRVFFRSGRGSPPAAVPPGISSRGL